MASGSLPGFPYGSIHETVPVLFGVFAGVFTYICMCICTYTYIYIICLFSSWALLSDKAQESGGVYACRAQKSSNA